MHDMTKHYLICALWSSNDESTPQGGNPLDDNYSIDDIAPESIERAEKDCLQFLHENKDDLQEWSIEQAGHDFWLTRNHHGAGFWDRGKGDTGERLTEVSQKYRELYPCVGNDGRIYFE